MAEPVLATLSGIRTVEEMIDAFSDEEVDVCLRYWSGQRAGFVPRVATAAR
jgi:hypothetical protein